MTKEKIHPVQLLDEKIYFIRGQKVMLDIDLAELYGVNTKRLNEQVKRNLKRFPESFMFQLSKKEFEDLRSQIATANLTKRRSMPYAFTEHGAVMLASVLNSDTAISASIQVVMAFVRLREWVFSHHDLSKKLKSIERKYDSQFKMVFDAIRQLTALPEKKKRQIGFKPEKKKD